LLHTKSVLGIKAEKANKMDMLSREEAGILERTISKDWNNTVEAKPEEEPTNEGKKSAEEPQWEEAECARGNSGSLLTQKEKKKKKTKKEMRRSRRHEKETRRGECYAASTSKVKERKGETTKPETEFRHGRRGRN